MFGHLNVHSHYSLLRGIAKVPDLLEKAKESGCDALALTDSHNMYGAIEFYKKARDVGIRPILGTTLSVQLPSVSQFYPLVLLAENVEGYRNILTLVTLANFVRGSTPFVTLEQLSASSEGVVALLPALFNPVQQALLRNDRSAAAEYLQRYQHIFGKNFYAGISPQNSTPRGSDVVEPQTEALIALAKDLAVPLVPLPLIYLLQEDSLEARDVLLRIQKTSLSYAEESVFEDPLVFPEAGSIEAWCDAFCPGALKNLSELISRIDWELSLGEWVFPDPPVSEEIDHDSILRNHIERGYAFRGLTKTKELEERAAFEFGVISDRGYVDYFLTVISLIKYMREHGILTTTRGSAAGSFVSYLCGITNVDPIEYQLPFERFLNPFPPFSS